MAETIVYYHSDADGECSAVAYKKYSGIKVDRFVRINYGYDSDIIRDEADKGNRLVFVDFTPKLEDIQYVVDLDSEAKMNIYDHHANAHVKFIEHFSNPAVYECERSTKDWVRWYIGGAVDYTFAHADSGLAGCGLVWNYFNTPDGSETPEGDMPAGIRLINDWDVWNHTNPDVISLHTVLTIMNTDPEKYGDEAIDFWEELFEAETEEIAPGVVGGMIPQLVNTGDLLLKFKYMQDDYRIKKNGRIVELPDAMGKALVVNGDFDSSYSFDDMYNPEEIDCLIWYTKIFNGAYKYCIRTIKEKQDKFDVSVIARAFGGNGHPGAAGFSSDKELF